MEIKILHIFPKLLSLYGEYGNVAILKKTLEDLGHTVTVTGWETEDVALGAYDFCYMGSGTEDNLKVALQRLLPVREQICASVASGKQWLVTGNAMALFGKTLDGAPALGLFGYETQIAPKRFLGDVLSSDGTLGFINTSCVYQGIETPLLTLSLGSTLGNEKNSGAEGLDGGNFLATQLIGPFLVKNPHWLGKLVEAITGKPWSAAPDSNMALAYATAHKELSAR